MLQNYEFVEIKPTLTAFTVIVAPSQFPPTGRTITALFPLLYAYYNGGNGQIKQKDDGTSKLSVLQACVHMCCFGP